MREIFVLLKRTLYCSNLNKKNRAIVVLDAFVFLLLSVE